MTSRTTTLIRKGIVEERYPDFPPRDDMQNWRHLYRNGMQMALQVHFQSEPSITVACEVPVGPSLSARGDVRIPDLSVMKGGDTELMLAQGGYAIDGQGKAPDFVLEIASPTTGVADYTDKRDDYERYGVLEYWRFDPSGGTITTRRLRATVWWTAGTKQLPLRSWETTCCAGTARRSTCIYAGSMGGFGSSTPRRAVIFALTARRWTVV